ncbi:ABC transporter substrate-binding protein [Paenalcaligenes niemegkensis]|uniref:ABC transporter substrate-binding protein n=1 Tax=Paenalcaligenes niemegkensis TaxID=2895469 RepID=UPI001EE869F6|nr:ABC transporter substrate-binding protein [Paenalcaligenes niemegkensis]MCQ9615505.1 ABC transporter substrate-binding protein [Paenalcaligenes niemegkensis]
MSTLNRRNFVKSMTIGAGLLAALPLSSRLALAQQNQTVNYGGSQWLGHYPAYVGMQNGTFETNKIKLGWESFGTSSGRMSALMAGNIDIAGTGVVSAIALMARNVERFYLIGVPENFGRVEGLFTQEDVNSVNDLRGKTIGTTFASSSHMLVLDLLAQNNLKVDTDVNVVNVPAPELPAALQSKQIDACATWTPYFNQISNMPGIKLLADDTEFSLYKEFGVTPGPDVLVVSKSFADKNPDLVKAFAVAYFETCALLGSEPEKAVDILTELTQLSADEQLQTIKDADWYDLATQKSMLEKDSKFIEGLQKLADMLVEFGQIDKSPEVARWVKADFV